MHRSAKHSRTSVTQSGVSGVDTSGGWWNTTGITLHQVDSSICHLSDKIGTIFMDPLKSISATMAALNALGSKLPKAQQCFMKLHLSNSQNVPSTVIFTSEENNEACLEFISDLYNSHHPVAASTVGTSSLLQSCLFCVLILVVLQSTGIQVGVYCSSKWSPDVIGGCK